jgi:phosphotransferase system HPr (HPr) family protein
MHSAKFLVKNPWGLHARASAFVASIALACSPDWDVVCIHGDTESSAKDIMSVMMLGAGPGAEIEFVSLLPRDRWTLFIRILETLFFEVDERGDKTNSYREMYLALREANIIDRGFSPKPTSHFSSTLASLPNKLTAAASRLRTEKFFQKISTEPVVAQTAIAAIEHVGAARRESQLAVMSSKEIDLFISHDTKDVDLARQFYDACCSRKLIAFLASECLPALGNTDFHREIERALERSKHLVLVASSSAHLDGGWVRAEWMTFLNEKRSGRKVGNLITLRTPNLSIAEMPFMLRGIQSEVINPNGEFTRETIVRILNLLGLLQGSN